MSAHDTLDTFVCTTAIKFSSVQILVKIMKVTKNDRRE